MKKALFLLVSLFASTARANLEDKEWVFHADDGREVRVPRHGGPRGTPLVDVAEIAAALGLKLEIEGEPSPRSTSWRLSNPSRRLSAFLRSGDKNVRTPFGTVALTRAPSENRESTRVDAKTSVLVPIEFGDRVLRPLLTSRAPLLPPKPDAKAKPAVIIDPGHGGNDWGASLDHDGVTVREKDLVLEIARALRDELAKSKISAALTRDADLYLTLPERTRLANASGAKAFLSLHLNSEPSAKTRGFELYVLSLKGGESDARAAVALENQIIPEDASQEVERALAELRSEANFEASLGLAKAVAAPLKKAHKAHGTGVKTGPFYVLYGAEMPALLVEWGFLTQPEERKALLDPAARDRWVRAVAQGLGLWLKTAR